MLMFQAYNMVVVYTYLAMGYLLLIILSDFLEGFRYLVLSTIIQLSMYNLQ